MKVCVGYSIDGEETGDFSRALPRLAEAKPVYRNMPSFYGLELRENHLPQAAPRPHHQLLSVNVKPALLPRGGRSADGQGPRG